MPHLDPRTIVLLAMSMCALMTIMLYSAYLSFPKTIGGLKAWAIGSIAMAASGIFLNVGTPLPDWLDITLGDLLYIGAIQAWYEGCRQLFGLSSARRRWLPLQIVLAVLLICLTYFRPDYQLRLILITGLAAWLYATMTDQVWKQAERTFASAFWLLILFIGVLINAVRCITAFDSNTIGSNLLSPVNQQQIYLVGLALLAFLNPVGFFLLATHRLSRTLEAQANFDSLTGLLNRRALLHLAQNAMLHQASHQSHALLLIDLDHFKKINDTYGHDTGDRVLCHFSNSVRAGLRQQDYFARFGGEEFVLLLLNTNGETALSYAQGILYAPKIDTNPDLPPYTCSIGLATQSNPGEDFPSLLRRADTALYRAKENGRNAIVCAE